jgi:hypothetical protein
MIKTKKTVEMLVADSCNFNRITEDVLDSIIEVEKIEGAPLIVFDTFNIDYLLLTAIHLNNTTFVVNWENFHLVLERLKTLYNLFKENMINLRSKTNISIIGLNEKYKNTKLQTLINIDQFGITQFGEDEMVKYKSKYYITALTLNVLDTSLKHDELKFSSIIDREKDCSSTIIMCRLLPYTSAYENMNYIFNTKDIDDVSFSCLVNLYKNMVNANDNFKEIYKFANKKDKRLDDLITEMKSFYWGGSKPLGDGLITALFFIYQIIVKKYGGPAYNKDIVDIILNMKLINDMYPWIKDYYKKTSESNNGLINIGFHIENLIEKEGEDDDNGKQ